MAAKIDYQNAVEIVKQLYSAAKNPLLHLELEQTKGNLRYRPYAVYYKLLMLEYRRITKADEVTFAYVDNLRNILALQRSLDIGDTVPTGETVDDYLAELNKIECNKCATAEAENLLGIYII